MNRLNTDRLLEMLMSAGPGVSACDVLQQYKDEFDNAIAAAQAAAVQYARDNPTRYGVVRLAMGIRAYGSEFVEALKPVEYLSVTLDDLPRFAKSAGVGLVDLTEVLDGRRYEVQGHNKQVYRSWETPPWSSSRLYIDNSARDKHAVMLAREDSATLKRMEARQTLAMAAKQSDSPIYTEWSN